MTRGLYRKIMPEFKPDIVIGVVRGGVHPAMRLAKHFNVRNMHFLTVRKVAGGGRRVVTKITEDLRGKKILLVEDMLESGKSLIAALRYLKRKKAIVKTVCYYLRPDSLVRPDYYIHEHEHKVTFPWE